MRTKQHRWAGVAIIAGSALVLSLLSVTPASADTIITGQVFDAGIPVQNVDVSLYNQDPATGIWTVWGDQTTDADGTWAINTGSVPDGQLALAYRTEESTAIFTAGQFWDGSSPYQMSTIGQVTAQFAVAGGVASVTSFPYTLKRNAGVLNVRLQDDAGATITGSGTDGFGSLDLGSGFPFGYDTVDGIVISTTNAEEDVDFDGTVTLGHIAPATYPAGVVDAQDSTLQNYEAELLNPVTITAGTVTNYGSATLQVNGSPSVDVLLPSAWNVQITGAAKVGAVLTAVTPPAPVAISYQWLVGIGYVVTLPIAGANSQTFVPTASEFGSVVAIDGVLRAPGHVSESLHASYSGIGLGTFTNPVQIGDPNAPSVTITGSAKLNGKLKAHVNGGLPGANTSLQWYRNGAVIADADGSTFTIDKSDLGASIFVSAKSTVQGHSDAVIPSAALAIQKDAASVKATTDKTISTKATPKVKISLKNGKTKLSAKAIVRVYYTATKYKSVVAKPGTSVTAKLPKLKKGTTTLKVIYQGNSYYVPKTITIKVKVSK